MVDSKIFCNVPWTNFHMYWDGSFGICCSEQSRWHNNPEYNIKNMSVNEWFEDKFITQVREKFLLSSRLPACISCYNDEKLGKESKRDRENFKSAIFTRDSFERSFIQSPWYDTFINNNYRKAGRDWHIDLGNDCNFACKMCFPKASSRIASLLKHHGDYTGPIRESWIDDERAYANFIKSIDNTDINRLHFMGGEPTIIPAFKNIIKHCRDTGRKNMSISFVSNGSNFDAELLEILSYFNDVDIEISLESIEKNNDYIRQGSNTTTVLENIIKLNTYKNIQLVLRSVPQLLNVYNYNRYIEFAFQHNLVIESVLCIKPAFMAINVLPLQYRQELKQRYITTKLQIPHNNGVILNGRHPDSINLKLINECDTIINMLDEPDPYNQSELQQQLLKHCVFWDKIFNMNARDYIPEYNTFWDAIGYD